jgi:hypothetical protein
MHIASIAILAAALLSGAVAGEAMAQSEPAKRDDRAAQACENEVTATVMRMRGTAARNVRFVPSRRILDTVSDEEIGVKGEGSYRGGASGGTPFTYTCTFNPATGSTSGVVFRDDSAAAPRAAAEQAWQPDLTNLSPAACETATATALKDRYPHVVNIVFGSDSRRLRPGPNGHTSLEGQGSAARAPGMSPAHFSYRCEVDSRGTVLGVQLGD